MDRPYSPKGQQLEYQNCDDLAPKGKHLYEHTATNPRSRAILRKRLRWIDHFFRRDNSLNIRIAMTLAP